MKEDSFHHGNLRAALLDAGVAAVEARGAADVSLRDLAREVGVSPTAAYRHFADKTALFAAIADRGFSALADASRAAPVSRDPRERLMSLARAYASFAERHPQMYRLMFAEPLDMERLAAESEGSVSAYRQLHDAVWHVVGEAAGEDAVTDAIVRLWSTLHGYVTLRLANRLPRLATVEDRLEPVLRPVIASL